MKRIVLEVAIETPDDAYAAAQGGADRLELCSALDLGGLTPSLGMLEEIRRFSDVPTCVMIRPRPGDFVYSPAEVDIMRRDIEHFLPLKPAGFVFGVLDEEGRIELEACLKLVTAAQGVPCVFHRAFDKTPDPAEAIDQLVQLGFQRILSCGQADTALEGVNNLARLVALAGERIIILACGRIRARNVVQVIKASGVVQVHGSFAEPVPELPGRGRRGYTTRSQTSRDQVQATRELLDRPWEWATL